MANKDKGSPIKGLKGEFMKTYKTLLLVLIVLVLGYLSVEIRPLDEVQSTTQELDANLFAQNFVDELLPTSFSNAVPLNDLITEIKNNKEYAFEQWSNALAVGDIGYFLISTTGIVTQITNDETILSTSDGLTAKLQTEFVYGNAIRDASNLIDHNEFQNTSDLNDIAAAINKIIRQKTIPPFKDKVTIGDSIRVIGALELNLKFPMIEEIEIQPINLQFN